MFLTDRFSGISDDVAFDICKTDGMRHCDCSLAYVKGTPAICLLELRLNLWPAPPNGRADFSSYQSLNIHLRRLLRRDANRYQ